MEPLKFDRHECSIDSNASMLILNAKLTIDKGDSENRFEPLVCNKLTLLHSAVLSWSPGNVVVFQASQCPKMITLDPRTPKRFKL